MKTCAFDGCSRPVRARSFCTKHYARLHKHGDPSIVIGYEDRFGTIDERFWSKVRKTETCWEWIGALTPEGYGNFVFNGRVHKSHRVAYEIVVGEIPAGLQIDHLCRNRACVNPNHLEPVTPRENSRRATAIGHHPNAPKTCKRGHDWSVIPPYLARRSEGRVTRRCRVCQNEQDRERRKHLFVSTDGWYCDECGTVERNHRHVRDGAA